MPRMFVRLLCFGLSDESIEEAIYDSQAIRAVVGIDAGRDYFAQVSPPPRVEGADAPESRHNQRPLRRKGA